MTQSRRKFLGAVASVVAFAWGARSLVAQGQGQPDPPIFIPFPRQSIEGPMPQRRLSAADRMKMNQEQIRKHMTRLKEVVSELEKEFAANNTAAVLSMNAVRRTEEIEKLARDIRGLIRG